MLFRTNDSSILTFLIHFMLLLLKNYYYFTNSHRSSPVSQKQIYLQSENYSQCVYLLHFDKLNCFYLEFRIAN